MQAVTAGPPRSRAAGRLVQRRAPRRSHTKYSTFPAGPGSGLAVIPLTPRPRPLAAAATARTASARAAGRGPRRQPRPYPCRPRTAASPSARNRRARRAHLTRAGSTSVSEMNDRSATTRSGGGATWSGSSARTFTRSSTVTRGRCAATRRAARSPRRRRPRAPAPARSSTSVNPPVDAPASRQRRPATPSPANAAQRPGELVPAARDVVRIIVGERAGATVSAASRLTWVAGLAAACPPTATRPAEISSAACSRDLASPRRTSSASSLDRSGARVVTAPAALARPAGPGGPGGAQRAGAPASPSSPRISRSLSWTDSSTAGCSSSGSSQSGQGRRWPRPRGGPRCLGESAAYVRYPCFDFPPAQGDQRAARTALPSA